MLWDSRTGKKNSVVSKSSLSVYGLSADVKDVFYAIGFKAARELHVFDTQSQDDTLIGTMTGRSLVSPMAVSSDGRWIAYVSSVDPVNPEDTNGASDIVLFDRALQSRTIVSRTATAAVANGPSDRLALSGDGRFVAYRSRASNLVDG